MRIGIISDIHSNVVAFRECIRILEEAGCDEYLFLGDYVSDTPYARETMDYLYDFMDKHVCFLLRGNREEYMLSQRKAVSEKNEKEMWKANSSGGSLLYTYERLTEKDLDFFEALPITFVYEKVGYPSITCCHGSPASSRELLELYTPNTREWLGKVETDYLLCAHTHFPGDFLYKGKYYFNSGCVGISIGEPGIAQCMMLESAKEGDKVVWKPVHLKVPYDVSRVVSDCFSLGLSDMAPWFINNNIQILLTGIDDTVKLVRLTKELANKDGFTDSWVNMNDKYFEAAAKLIGMKDYRIK